jgi:hypothetical protein
MASGSGHNPPNALRNMIAESPLSGEPEIVVDFYESCQWYVPKSPVGKGSGDAVGRYDSI